MGLRGRGIGAILAALALAGCAASPAPAPVAPVPVATAPQASPASRAARDYYGRVQAAFLARGLLRTDGGQGDVPWADRQLAEAFLRVALYDEFRLAAGTYVARESASRLRRWQAPVRVALRFGDSVPEAERAVERVRMAGLLQRLSRATGHPVRLAEGDANFLVYVVSEDERRALGPEIRRVMPRFGQVEIDSFANMPQGTYCQVSVIADGQSWVYQRAFAVIRAELPDLMRLSCLHEEMAQGLGLPNDSPRARPSIFNDDQEFALLTPMDEAMLRMLYDPRLSPGMDEAAARPIVGELAAGLTAGLTGGGA